MHPMFSVSGVGGAVVGPGGLALSCEVVDQSGGESDSCTVVVDDRDGEVGIPAIGTKITVQMGYRETGMSMMGMFTIETVTVDGWPRSMTITGRGADLSGNSPLKTAVSQDFHKKTVGEIIPMLAKQGGIGAKVSGSVAGFMYDFFAQTEESPMATATRLGVKHDAVATVKNGLLVFVKKGEGMAGGVAAIFPENVKSYSVTFKGRPEHGETQGSWFDKEIAERKEEKGGGGTGSVIAQLPALWSAGQKEAQEMAKSRGTKNARDEAEIDITIIGDPSAMAQGILTVSGVRGGVDGAWLIKEARHIIDNSGYETVIHGEKPA